MDLSDVALFRLIASAGSLNAVARRIGASPMAVSRRLARLEQQVGARLVHRSTRSLSLSADGESFLPFAEELLDTQEEALSSLGDASNGHRGTLRVTAPSVVGRTIIAPVLWQMMRESPLLHGDLVLSDRRLDLIEDRIDVAIRITQELSSDTIASRLSSAEGVLCASPCYIERCGRPGVLADLADHSCAVLHDLPVWRFQHQGRPIDLRVHGVVRGNTLDAVVSACMAGLGIAQVLYWDVANQLRSGELKRIKLEDAAPRDSTMWSVYPSNRQVPRRVKSFIDRLRIYLEAMD